MNKFDLTDFLLGAVEKILIIGSIDIVIFTIGLVVKSL